MVAVPVPVVAERDVLLRRRCELEATLSASWRRIDAAIAAGEEVELAERLWLRHLDTYVAICDALRESDRDGLVGGPLPTAQIDVSLEHAS